jgi:DNA-binding PadR family transcriptional regulator
MPALRVVFLAGFIRAYLDYLDLIADAHEVDSANARLSADGDEHDQADSIRLTILKAAFAHAGARAKELVSVVAQLCVVNESSVKFHIKKLVGMKLIERLELGPKAVSYRITPLGEAVLARRSKPYELALFVINEAAFDAPLRAAIKNEINLTWLDETTTRQDQKDTKAIADSNVLPFLRPPTVEDSSSMSHGLNKMFTQYQKIQKKENTA